MSASVIAITAVLLIPTFTDEELAARANEVRAQLTAHELEASFTIVYEPPFVVVGDGPAARVRERARGTVRWAVAKLKERLFERDPERVLVIWLFKNNASYRRHTRLLFNDDPDTPFGYYSPEQGALIMNIATGGGTLVHEIVHPFLDAACPDCPSWLGEGLASLYEQCGERDGHVVGLTNWRLAGLQRAIVKGKLRTFASLLATTSDEFYGDDSSTNYAQARYLMYYLQERGLLLDFYQALLKAPAHGSAGLAALKKVLGRQDLDVFQKEWESYVLRLKYP